MPVLLPPQPPGVILPPQPQDPPTLADVVAAKAYQARVDVATGRSTSTSHAYIGLDRLL
jgi:hypothetical protein